MTVRRELFLIRYEDQATGKGKTVKTNAATLRGARSAARKFARSKMPFGFTGYGHYWRVLDRGTGEELASGRLRRGR